jgi:hypothetical protein
LLSAWYNTALLTIEMNVVAPPSGIGFETFAIVEPPGTAVHDHLRFVIVELSPRLPVDPDASNVASTATVPTMSGTNGVGVRKDQNSSTYRAPRRPVVA